MWDLSEVEELGIKAGDYVVSVAEAEVKESKSGGEYIKVKFVTENGQVIFHNFNTKNDNPKAVEIGLGQLKTFLRVSGKTDPNSLRGVEEILGLRTTVKVKIDDNGSYGPQPRITSFKPAPKTDAAPF